VRRRPVAALLLVVTVATLSPSCGPSGPTMVLVDNRHDEFAASMIDFFPDHVVVHPGDTVRFRQRWSGEPHSVTFGSLFNDELGRIRRRLAQSPAPTAEDLAELEALDELPVMLGRGDDEFVVNQHGAQPCYLERGAPPDDPDEACPDVPQPAFTGRHTYYSSGFIPFGGERGNRFDVHLSDDVEPGDYHFYCNLHGVGQSGTMTVVAAEEPLPSRSAADRRTRSRISTLYGIPLAQAMADAESGRLRIDGQSYVGPFAGAATTHVRPWGGAAHRKHFGHRHGSVDEFLPGELGARVGRPVTWTFVGRHTISFNVPRYLPVFAVEADGTVRIDPRVHEPVGWSIPPAQLGAPPRLVDVGEWDGEGFVSTGLDWRTGDRFRVTFTRPGTYPLACLVHPGMVGQVEVSA
jgi:plastocyanin